MTLLLPLAFDVKNGYRHTDKLYIKFKTWFNFCACIMNSKAQLSAVIKIHFNGIVASGFKLESYKFCRKLDNWNRNSGNFHAARLI